MLKAVLFGFNGVIVNDEAVHQRLIEALLLEENLRPDAAEYMQVCLGRSDQACLMDLLNRRGRYVTEESLVRLIRKKTLLYQDWLAARDQPPLYPGLEDLIFRARAARYPMAIVTGAQRSEVEAVLQKAGLIDLFPVIISGDSIPAAISKPAPDSYGLAIAELKQRFPDLHLKPDECVAIEDAYPGIEAAKQAGIPVIGVAHTYPYHMIQRCATWAVDYLIEIDFDWIRQRYPGELLLAPGSQPGADA
jgi:beta-phosphoglucomutase